MAKVVELVEELVTPICQSIGLELVDVEYQKKHDGFNLTVFIDKEGGITLDDCEKLHNLIDGPLDELNPTNDAPYILNVSSCGLDRPLTKHKDYVRNIGKKVEFKYYAPINGKKVVEGTIVSVSETIVVINDGKQDVEIDLSKVASCLPVIEF